MAAPESQSLEPLLDLAQACVVRHDTSHPVFHGCIDWHSAVHGYWALLWGTRAASHPERREWLAQQLSSSGLARELADFEQHWPMDFELPYGRAWFLQLAEEAEISFGDGRFLPVAQRLHDSLWEFARHGGGDPLSQEYDNASWALYHLARWARFRHKTKDWQEIRTLALIRLEKIAIFPEFSTISGFFDPAALALLLLEEVEGWESPAWQRIRQQWQKESLQPLRFPFAHAHQGGLNYARAWGLAALYRREQDPVILTAWHRHMAAMADTLPSWGTDYGRYGHWVAQFGVFAWSKPP